MNTSQRGGRNRLRYTAGPLEETIARPEDAGARVIAEPKPCVAFGAEEAGWLGGEDPLPIERVEGTAGNAR